MDPYGSILLSLILVGITESIKRAGQIIGNNLKRVAVRLARE
jgi:hypothetical protein